MHNFKFYAVDYDKSLDNVTYKVRNRKRNYIDRNKDVLLGAHKNYKALAVAGNLKNLVSFLSCPGKREKNHDNDYWIAYDLYDTNLTYVTKHWDELERLNGGKSLKCPICGLTHCTEMDHFAPRSKFPEQSCNLTNLIPLCHDCNNDKGNKWLDRKNNQIFFNAFFDNEIPDSVIDCGFILSAKKDTIRVEVSLSSKLVNTNPQHQRAINSIKELKLLPKFESRANEILNREIRGLKARYQVEKDKYTSMDEFYNIYLSVVERLLGQKDSPDFIEKEVLEAIIASKVFEKYIKSILSKY